MIKKTPELWKYLIVGLFFILDRFFKSIATTSEPSLFLGDLIGFEYFENFGIAFGVPIPLWVIIVFTPLLLIFLLFVIERSKNAGTLYLWFFLIFLGAVSNLFDRMVYGFVIDYFRIVTAMINVADIMIVAGMIQVFLFIHPRRS